MHNQGTLMHVPAPGDNVTSTHTIPNNHLNQRYFAIQPSVRSGGDFGIIDEFGEVQQSSRDFICSRSDQVRREHESILLMSLIDKHERGLAYGSCIPQFSRV